MIFGSILQRPAAIRKGELVFVAIHQAGYPGQLWHHALSVRTGRSWRSRQRHHRAVAVFLVLQRPSSGCCHVRARKSTSAARSTPSIAIREMQPPAPVASGDGCVHHRQTVTGSAYFSTPLSGIRRLFTVDIYLPAVVTCQHHKQRSSRQHQQGEKQEIVCTLQCTVAIRHHE